MDHFRQHADPCLFSDAPDVTQVLPNARLPETQKTGRLTLAEAADGTVDIVISQAHASNTVNCCCGFYAGHAKGATDLVSGVKRPHHFQVARHRRRFPGRFWQPAPIKLATNTNSKIGRGGEAITLLNKPASCRKPGRTLCAFAAAVGWQRRPRYVKVARDSNAPIIRWQEGSRGNHGRCIRSVANPRETVAIPRDE